MADENVAGPSDERQGNVSAGDPPGLYEAPSGYDAEEWRNYVDEARPKPATSELYKPPSGYDQEKWRQHVDEALKRSETTRSRLLTKLQAIVSTLNIAIARLLTRI